MRGTHPERALEQAVERSGAIREGEHIAIACSGGSDSVGLAALLAAAAKPLKLQLLLVHVNHGLRPSAWQDEAVALRVAAALGMRLRVEALVPGKRDEASLREARYAVLERVAREEGAGAVATGHHAEDQTETVLLGLFRGAGHAGLAGMPARRELGPGIHLLRPLLRLERAVIRGYVQRAGLPYAIDPSNADASLRRNAVREALASLRPAFPGLDQAVSRAAEVVAGELAETPRAALRRQVRSVLREHHALRGVDFQHVEAAVEALERGASGRFSMGPGIELAIENGQLTVHREER